MGLTFDVKSVGVAENWRSVQASPNSNLPVKEHRQLSPYKLERPVEHSILLDLVKTLPAPPVNQARQIHTSIQHGRRSNSNTSQSAQSNH
jgi:hypothetical protein